jgi:hypothetical protein
LSIQRMEDALFGLMLLELFAPFGFQLQTADDDHLGIIGDTVFFDQMRHLVLRFDRDPLVDLLTALLRVALEVAFLHGHAQASFDDLHELLLGGGRLAQEDADDRFDLGAFATDALLTIFFIHLVHQTGEALDTLIAGRLTAMFQQFSQSAQSVDGGDLSVDADFAFGILLGSNAQCAQAQEDGGRRDDHVLVVAFATGLFVEGGGQLAIDLFQFRQHTRVRCALTSDGQLLLERTTVADLLFVFFAVVQFAPLVGRVLVEDFFFVLAILVAASVWTGAGQEIFVVRILTTERLVLPFVGLALLPVVRTARFFVFELGRVIDTAADEIVETAQQLLLTTGLEFDVVHLIAIGTEETSETEFVQLGLAEGISQSERQSDQNEATHFCIRF